MAWLMNTHRRDDHDQYRWERPPQVEEGQTALVHAPRAASLLEHPTATDDQADRSHDSGT